MSYTAGSKSEYLAAVLRDYPDRDAAGYVIGYAVFDGWRRVSGTHRTIAEASATVASMEYSDRLRGRDPLRYGIAAGRVVTATGQPVHASMLAPVREGSLFAGGAR